MDTETENAQYSETTASTLQSSLKLTPRVQIASICSVLLVISFFLPWFRALFGFVNVSGFMLGNEDGYAKLVWAMPAFALVSLLAGLSGNRLQVPGQLAGAIPFGFLGYALYHHGTEFFNIIEAGGWLALISGAVLFVSASKA
jgi:hypothetical protein